MFEHHAAARSESTDVREHADVLSERATDRQNRWAAERNEQRRELITRDSATTGPSRWGGRDGRQSTRRGL